ncbi:hypothetical protein [uncultured Corynebacterium sp.]|uniref:hypothetical protein n=1 Tax=uncultured Corynebacterium sp. TaxID=159447 RepID=UPI0025D2D843|nr:hypothetical protein [uncultured Corynebacterium sp.]
MPHHVLLGIDLLRRSCASTFVLAGGLSCRRVLRVDGGADAGMDAGADADVRRCCYASTVLRDVLSGRVGAPYLSSNRCRLDHHAMTS